ncbi:MAG: biosynthetic-type acetolactate synthase large subunit [Thiotrichaceae bacterium]|nr:biosynthetic-type acetolactate synthase large subunit [Thiotrichaceae bacterium]
MANKEMLGADILVNALAAENVEYLFGYPGGVVLHIYDAIFKQDKIEHILVRHEQAAVHAADGYARSTGKPGVALVTSGPGATNTITGIATAYMDSIPMVIITGQVHSTLIGNDAFQEVDAVGISRPCVKHNFLVKDVKKLASTIKKAFYIATTGRPGPVLIDVPKDVTTEMAVFEYPETIEMRSYNPVVTVNSEQIRQAIELILSAKRPVIYSGGGVILGNGVKELIEFTRLLSFPITQTMMGLGAYPATDSQSLGMLGMHGTYEANMAMHGCDVLIAIGARFDDRVTGELEKFCPQAKVIHLDIDPASISKNVKVDIPLLGTVPEVLQELINGLNASGRQASSKDLTEWWGQIDTWRSTDCLRYNRKSDLIKPQYVIEKLYEVTKGEAFIASDVGQHQMFAAQFYKFDKPRRWLSSGGLGTMGFGLPAAMGAQFAHPNESVVCITGEASIQMCIQELSTCKQFDLPIKIIMLNNGFLGMVRQWQEMFYGKRYSQSYVKALPDFVKLAESYGHVGMRIEKPSDVVGALKEGFAIKDRLVFMDFVIDPTENVYPMVAAGKGHNEMVLSPEMESA